MTLRIEDKTSEHFEKLIEDSLALVFLKIPKEDLQGIEKILLLDECPDKVFKRSGGFYCAAHDEAPAYIELYPQKIIEGIPFLLPKIRFFKKYSIVRMFLHELGHHNYWKEDMNKKEEEANKYMLSYLWKIYGAWNYFFNFMGLLGDTVRNERCQNSITS